MAKKRINKTSIIYIGIAIATVVLNVIAWNSRAFCDAYIAYIFPIWVNTYGRITGIFPFSVGEWMLVLGVLLVVIAVLWLPVLLVVRMRINADAFAKIVCRIGALYYKVFAWIILGVCLVMTLNCFILYHASTFSDKYYPEDDGSYTLEELITVRNYVVEQVNFLSEIVPRDENGDVIYMSVSEGEDVQVTGMMAKMQLEEQDVDWRRAIEDKSREVMQQMGTKYPQLNGYYPRPKALLASDFMCQQYMLGYYFPFSMEANYNDVAYILNQPSSMCHELAHLRGYIYEDEANFISYIACVESDDIIFQYSGYLSVLNYLDNDFYQAVNKDRDKYYEQVVIKEQVHIDNVFVKDEEWERINAEAVLDTEFVDEVSDTFIDTTLKINGVSDGAVSYSRVVNRLLQYYRQEGLP